MKFRKILALAVILAGTATIGPATAETLKIGLISSKSGVFAIFGTSGEKGAMLAADEINAAGGVLGRKIELLSSDSKSRPEEASRLFRESVAQGAVVVLGIVGSGETQAVSTLAREQKVPFFTGLGYARFLTEEAGHRYFFRIVTNSSAYYGPMVDRLVKDGLVVRLSREEDRRATFVRLSREGERRFAEMAGVHEKWVDELLGGIDPTTVARLTDTFDRPLRRKPDGAPQ